MLRNMLAASATMLILLTVLNHPDVVMAHGGSDMDQDPCARLAGDSTVHFSAYQPQYELRKQYCTEIPQEGDTFLVVDLVDPVLRDEPVGMRVIRGNGKNEPDGEIVADIRPSTHPDGVLRSEVRLGEGLYRVIIASEKHNLLKRPQYLLRVHMTDYPQLILTMAGPLLGLLVVAWFGYKVLRSAWLRNWWAALRS